MYTQWIICEAVGKERFEAALERAKGEIAARVPMPAELASAARGLGNLWRGL